MLGNWDLKIDVYYYCYYLSFWFLFLINVFLFFTESILKKEEEAFETFEGIIESCNLSSFHNIVDLQVDGAGSNISPMQEFQF
jgi:hypothetical protein